LAVVPIAYILLPETNGRSLEKMGRIFSEPEHWWKVAPATRRLPRSGLEDIENFEEEHEKTKHVGRSLRRRIYRQYR